MTRNGAGYSVSIRIKRYGERGWEWKERGFSGGDGVPVCSSRCRTNKSGEGRWFWSNQTNGWKQDIGVCQYRLPQDRKKAYDKIRGEIIRFLST